MPRRGIAARALLVTDNQLPTPMLIVLQTKTLVDESKGVTTIGTRATLKRTKTKGGGHHNSQHSAYHTVSLPRTDEFDIRPLYKDAKSGIRTYVPPFFP